jgi:ornithine carbamoyltransferase
VKSKDLLSINDLNAVDINLLLADAVELKGRGWLDILRGKTLALLFEKPSLRTRVSFELAMKQLGGEALYLSPPEVGLGKREAVADVARVLERYVDVLAVRTFNHTRLKELAQNCGIPVINALSDSEHPCQALADLLTLYEIKGKLAGLRLAYVGDGNNVAASLLLACSMVGMHFSIASPPGYELDSGILEEAWTYAADSGSQVRLVQRSEEAVEGADAVYTDTWTSMGQESETEKRLKDFASFQVDSHLMRLAREDAVFMHCLPAHRGQEVTDEVMESPVSVIFHQAENRLHIQKAMLAQMLGGLEMPSCR